MLGCGRTESGIADAPIFAATLDAFVAVLVKAAKVLPHVLLPAGHHIPLPHDLEPPFEVSNGLAVKFVLMAFQIPELCELLVTFIELASKRFCGSVHNFMCSNVSPLRERLATSITAIRSFTGVSALMRLEVAELRKALTTARLLANLSSVSQILLTRIAWFTDKWLDTRVGTSVNFQVSFLVERLVAIRHCALIPLLRLRRAGTFWRAWFWRRLCAISDGLCLEKLLTPYLLLC